MEEKFVLKAVVDGSGNGAKGSACAAVVFDHDGIKIKEKTLVWGRGTNNIAEYRAVGLALEIGLALQADEMTIFSDSQLIVNQLQENWKCKDQDLRDIRDEVWEIADEFDYLKIIWVRRKKTKRPDHLCRVALKDLPDFIAEFENHPPIVIPE